MGINNKTFGGSRHKDPPEERERRIEALRRKIHVSGGNGAAYSRSVGVPRNSIQKMLMGEVRVTDRALGVKS